MAAPKVALHFEDVLHDVSNGVASITLNRPKALNALHTGMVEALLTLLRAWTKPGAAEAAGVSCVIIKGAGGKAFCAGGDIKAAVAVAQSKAPSERLLRSFMIEYAVDLDIAQLPIPMVALADGITMGGGAGLAMNAAFRVVTETTVFAMPECRIGMFPDAGASFFLQHLKGSAMCLPGFLGMFLALTGERLRGAELKECGLATHYVPSSCLVALEAEIIALGPRSRDFRAVDAILCKIEAEGAPTLAAAASKRRRGPSFGERLDQINRHFGHDSVAKIVQSLMTASGEAGFGGVFAKHTLACFSQCSPMSQLITFEQLKRAKTMTLAECLAMDLHLVQLFITGQGDWFEGVRTMLIDKGEPPHWKYMTLEMVPTDVVDAFFAHLPATIGLIGSVILSKL